MKIRTPAQWRTLRWMGALLALVLTVLNTLASDWWVAAAALVLGAAWVGLGTAGIRNAEEIERLRRAGGAR